jgi:hypothetical protein
MPPIRVLTVYYRVSSIPTGNPRRQAFRLCIESLNSLGDQKASDMQNLFHIGRKHVTVLDENATLGKTLTSLSFVSLALTAETLASLFQFKSASSVVNLA